MRSGRSKWQLLSSSTRNIYSIIRYLCRLKRKVANHLQSQRQYIVREIRIVVQSVLAHYQLHKQLQDALGGIAWPIYGPGENKYTQ